MASEREELKDRSKAMIMTANSYMAPKLDPQGERIKVAFMFMNLAGMIELVGTCVSDLKDRLDKLDRDIAGLKSRSTQQPRR
jgi:hypothetical protein